MSSRRVFTVKIDCDTDAFGDDPSTELLRVLDTIKSRIAFGFDYSTYQTARDLNGNIVGQWCLWGDNHVQ